jgi:hypothetical protein
LGKRGVAIGFGVVAVIAGIVGLAFSYNNLQKAQQENQAAKQDVIKKCQDLKAAMLNPDLPQADYQNGLQEYNSGCAQYTGALK